MNTTKKDLFRHFIIDVQDLNLDLFKEKFITNLNVNSTYSIIIKLCSFEEQVYKMIGRQVGFQLTEVNTELLYHTILARIDMYSELYGIEQTIRSIDIMYKAITTDQKLSLNNITSLTLDRNLLKIKETREKFSFKLLPLTTNTNYFGRRLFTVEREEWLLKFNINSRDSEIFLYDSPSKQEILVVRSIQNITYIQIYDYLLGFLICEVKDEIISDNCFKRTINNVSLVIEGETIKQIEIAKGLDAIRYKHTSTIDRNKNIGSFDLETYKDVDGHSKVYAIGFYTNIDMKPQLFYLTDHNNNYNTELLILKCLDAMLITKYHNYTFYAHNFGGYDFIFIYNIIQKANADKGFEYYKLVLSTRDDSVLKLTIIVKTKENSKPIRIHIVDSLNLLSTSLEKLAQDFKVNTLKSYFPYSFVRRDTLLYVGPTPSIEFYPKLNKYNSRDINIYNNIYKSNWNLREETLYYLENDLRSLLEIMNEFSFKIYLEQNTELTEATTISRLSMNIFFKNYLKDQKIPSITNQSMFKFIKEGYFGGMTEVYKPYGEDLKYVDVNSLYPFAALNSMPGLNSIYIENYTDELDLNKLFGFFYAEVKAPVDTYFGLLPILTREGLIFPRGTFSGTWSSEELKFARDNGYSIKVVKGYNFDKVDSPFKNYINELYELKNEATDSRKTIFKSLLNNLIGRFGLNINKPITKEVTLTDRDYIASTREITTQYTLFDNKFLITYKPEISRKICEEHGLNYTKVLEKENKNATSLEINKFKDTSIVCAAMINSYARIYMNTLKLKLIHEGANIYYMDTDSLVLDIKGFEILNNNNYIGNKLGQFKLENNIIKAYFISNKTYCLITDSTENNIIIKAKGVNRNTLNLENFIELYNNKNITANRQNTIKNYEKAAVEINNKDITLRHNSYSKRIKIYNNEGRWIDTQPIEL